MCEDSADEVTGCDDDTCDLDTWYDNNDVDNTVEGTSEVFNTVLEEFGFVTTWSCLIHKQVSLMTKVVRKFVTKYFCNHYNKLKFSDLNIQNKVVSLTQDKNA